MKRKTRRIQENTDSGMGLFAAKTRRD